MVMTKAIYNRRGELNRYGLACGYKQTHGKTRRVIYMDNGVIFVTDSAVVESQGDAFVYAGQSLSVARKVWRTNDDAFVLQYLKTALWASVGDDEKPLDEKYSRMSFLHAAWKIAKKDCQKFLATKINAVRVREICAANLSTAAHDFWLNRNGHGSGFWDKPEIYGGHADSLASIAASFGGCTVIEIGDGMLSLL